ncbi:MAG: leucine-rich repeat protein [Prevotella sp.]|nr:leucine-rich repeat protein [Prevotella sp.]
MTIRRLLTAMMLIFLMGVTAKAYTTVPGFVGETWLDHKNQDDIFNPNFGNGSQNNPWKIKSAEGLSYLAYMVNKQGYTYEGEYFQIDSDINLTNYVWVPIGLDTERPFKGTLTNGSDAKGNPYVISGMTIYATSTETTQNFGLFGVLLGAAEGLFIRYKTIDINTNDEVNVGILCGHFGTSAVNGSIGSVSSCTVEGTTVDATINVTSSNSGTAVGGLIGTVYNFSKLESNLARTTIHATGPLRTGGVFGDVLNDRVITDCHAVVMMTIQNATDQQASAGGVTGYCSGYSANKTELLVCTASGDIAVRGDGTHVILGGITGYATYLQKLNQCTTSVSLSGAHTMGGLIGFYNNMRNSSSAGIYQCFCSSFVDAKKATYAGGLLGHLAFDIAYYDSNYWVGSLAVGQPSTTFAGTMTKPESTDSKYGIIVGYVENDKTPENFGFFRYDRKMCNLQLNGMGWNSGRWNPSSDYRLVSAFNYPTPQDGTYAYYQEAWFGQITMHLNNQEPFFNANMKVACAPFIVTNDYKTYYDAFDVTADFLVEKFLNETTGEELATFQFVTPAPSCVELNDKMVKLLDPGEAVVIVNCRGLQRKVHLDITYGTPWGGRISNYDFIGGNGTAKNPYVIQKPEQLLRVAYGGVATNSNYNKEGVHYILANDLFINKHLLQGNEEPRSDALKTWTAYNWKAVLHGNGKTIYGLYDTMSSNGARGLFAKVSGTIEDLAVVDAYVEAAVDADSISAGILCGELVENGVIQRCLVHGRVLSNGFAGGICGYAESSNTRISDCFVAAHVGWPGSPMNYIGAGIVGATPEELERCVSISKVENRNDIYGITINGSKANDCYFDRQMMATDIDMKGSTYTKDLISGTILSNNGNWSSVAGSYPMLKQFAHSPYGAILSLPISFYKDDVKADRAGSITEIFEFPTENVHWWAYNDDTYLDVINMCGAASPNGRTNNDTEFLNVEPTNSKSASTKPLRVTAVDVDSDIAGIKFKDPEAERACMTAFNDNGDDFLTLREAFENTDAEFSTFNSNAANVKYFPELRYFASVVTLKENMISGLDKLEEVVLPNSLSRINTNAFNGCMSLEEVELPFQFNTLDEGGFYGSGIKNILVNEKNPTCTSIDGALYMYDRYDDGKVMLMAYPPGRKEESATLSCPLSSILPNAIYKVPILKNVYIDNCLPEGEMAVLEDDGIIHEDPNEVMHIYVNDGSFNSTLFEEYCIDDMWSELYLDEDCLDIYYPLNVTSAGWATLYIDFPTQLPQGLTAYVALEKDSVNNIVVLKDVGRLIPRSTPVVIKADEPGLYPLYKYEGTVPDIAKYNNRFIGSFIGQDDKWGLPVNQETSEDGSILTLGRNSAGVLGFYKYNGEMIPPYRAYLTYNLVTEGPLQAAPYMRMVFYDDTVGIQEMNANRTPADNVYYTIDGRKLEGKPTKRGLYIINGKKVVIR